jgi:hypothetical protein
MAARYTGLGIWLCATCLGCNPIASAVRTTIIEPTEYSRRIDDCVDNHRNKALAKVALAEWMQARPDCLCSQDFARGFEEGFADFLFAGGPGNPPPVPPRYYWRPEFENPEGHKAIEEWYAGFREGSAAARASGYRQLVTVPSSLAARPSLGAAVPSNPKPPADFETLPEPVPPVMKVEVPTSAAPGVMDGTSSAQLVPPSHLVIPPLWKTSANTPEFKLTFPPGLGAISPTEQPAVPPEITARPPDLTESVR